MAAFEIDGREYPIPSVFGLTMGEAQTLYDYSGYALEDFVPPAPGEPDDKRMQQVRNPAFKRAMVHIAYQRGNPDVTRDAVASLVDGVQMFDMVAAMYQADDADPTPVSPNGPQTSSDADGPSTNESGGRLSSITAAPQDVIPVATGTTG